MPWDRYIVPKQLRRSQRAHDKLDVTRHNRLIENVPVSMATLVARVDRDQLAEVMLEAFRGAIPGYARLPETVVRGQIVEIIRLNVDLCLDWVAGGVAPAPERFEKFRASAMNRATEGMPLEDLLHAYRMGGTAAWRALVAEASEDERAALPHAAELVMVYLDQVSGTVAAAYLEEREHLVSEQERALRGLLDALLRGARLTAANHEAAERLGFPIGGKLVAFAAAIPGELARAHARAAALFRDAGALALTEGDRVVGVAAPGRDPARALHSEGLLVVDVEVPRRELADSLADVRLGIEIGLRDGRTGVVSLQELALELLLAHAPRQAAALRARVVGPLGVEDAGARGDLLRTVRTYVEFGRDRQRAANKLHIHPNTLDHRLRRARELTRLDLDDPEDLAMMVLALREAR